MTSLSCLTLNTVTNRRAAAPFIVVAAFAVIGGGLVSAVLAHAPTRPVMWLVAYLVLVVGVAQVVLGVGQTALTQRPLSVRLLTAECVLFNVANVLVMAGTLLKQLVWVTIGALGLVLALALFLFAVRAVTGARVFIYRAVLLVVGLGALVGVLLTALHVGT